jgi:hypothetical protein
MRFRAKHTINGVGADGAVEAGETFELDEAAGKRLIDLDAAEEVEEEPEAAATDSTAGKEEGTKASAKEPADQPGAEGK